MKLNSHRHPGGSECRCCAGYRSTPGDRQGV